MKSFVIKSNFFCLFKTGDNINYNLEILNCLYDHYESDPKNQRLLIKPIVVCLMSIVEAVLSDFHTRVKLNTVEGVKNLSKEVIDHIRSRKIDELEKYIKSAEKHNFFDLAHTNFYKKLDTLREVRNRVHIQNSKRYKPINEIDVFTYPLKELAEKCTEVVLKTMSKKYFRSETRYFVEDMNLPWKEYFPEEKQIS